MTTTATKTNRINISVSDRDRDFLEQISRREKKPLATTARDFLEMALEIQEDYTLEKFANERDKNGGKLVKNNSSLWV